MEGSFWKERAILALCHKSVRVGWKSELKEVSLIEEDYIIH